MDLWKTGVGTLTGKNLSSIRTSIISGAILANLPQALLSYLYLMFNGCITCMQVGEEWTRYFLTRKPLRVTSPKGMQRSTYYLQMPFRYSIPLGFASFLLHWLASESLFMVQIQVLDDSSPRRPDMENSISTVGYSPVAIILTTFVGTLIMLGGALLAWRRYPAGMPLAGTCSALISAACHPPEDDTKASLLLVHWGVVDVSEQVSQEDGQLEQDIVGHCSFTSFEVTEPIEGRLYR
jgi:hypothetical protein